MPDLHLSADSANASERHAVDAIMVQLDTDDLAVVSGRVIRGGAARARGRRHLLLPALHELQRARGWISPGAINYVADLLDVAPAEIYGVAGFYELFRLDDPGHEDEVVHVCVDGPCQILGAAAKIAEFEADGLHVHESPCLGQCHQPPGVFMQGRGGPDSTPNDHRRTELAQAGAVTLRLLRRFSSAPPTSLGHFLAIGGFDALRKAIQMGGPAVVEQVATAGLLGRGGAAFPTALKWRAVAEQTESRRHVVLNADESEPGTFRDRILMEEDPYAVLEGMMIAAVATGAEHGWIYIRGEYPLATVRLTEAVERSREAGYLGRRLAGTGQRFDIEIRRGAGAYVCGEETALFNSIEGFRGEPRNKPPYPTTHGLFAEPTAINNPETLVNVLDIVLYGGAAFAARGADGSTGSKLFCLSGHVAQPGLYEVEFGTRLGDLLGAAGGVVGELRAILLGGAAGSFVGPDALDMPLTFSATRERGATIGSGAVIVYNDTVDFVPVLQRMAKFFRDESCGKCVPCRIGTVRQHELLVRTDHGPLAADDKLLIHDMALAMRDASICGLGHAASTAVESAIKLGLIGGPAS